MLTFRYINDGLVSLFLIEINHQLLFILPTPGEYMCICRLHVPCINSNL